LSRKSGTPIYDVCSVFDGRPNFKRRWVCAEPKGSGPKGGPFGTEGKSEQQVKSVEF
jgi:hypothetical protein